MQKYLQQFTNLLKAKENHNDMEKIAYKLSFIAISAMITMYHAYFIFRNGFEVFNELFFLFLLVVGSFTYYQATKEDYRSIESLLIASGSLFFSVNVGKFLSLYKPLHVALLLVWILVMVAMITKIVKMKQESWQTKVVVVMNWTYLLGVITSLMMGLTASNIFNHTSAISLCYLLLHNVCILKSKSLKLVFSAIAFDVLITSLIYVDYFFNFGLVHSISWELLQALTIVVILQMYMLFNQSVQDKLIFDYFVDIVTPFLGVWLLIMNGENIYHFVIIAILIVVGILVLYKKESMEDIYETLSFCVMFYLIGSVGVYYLVYDFSFYGLVSSALLALFGFVCYIISISQLEYDEYDEELDETS